MTSQKKKLELWKIGKSFRRKIRLIFLSSKNVDNTVDSTSVSNTLSFILKVGQTLLVNIYKFLKTRFY